MHRKTRTHAHINVFQMSAFFTHAHTYKYTNVSKPAWLKVNTPALCTSQIRQFGRGEKHSLLTWEKALTSTWERGNLFVCCDWVCAQLNLRQNKYICHTGRKGWRGRQSWIEDKKEERIKSVTSCVNPGFSLTLTQLHCTWLLQSFSVFISLQIHTNVFIFIKQPNNIFDIFRSCPVFTYASDPFLTVIKFSMFKEFISCIRINSVSVSCSRTLFRRGGSHSITHPTHTSAAGFEALTGDLPVIRDIMLAMTNETALKMTDNKFRGAF